MTWRPSRWLVGALATMAALAPFAVLASEMPRALAWPLATAAAAHGAWLGWREARKPPRTLAWPPAEATLQWRGPMLFLRSPAGHLSWWPDTLDERTRGDLRRAMAP